MEGGASLLSAIKFNLREERKTSLSGTKTVSAKNQLLVSSGVPSLDFVVGGGLQVGSILLIEESDSGIFSNHLTKFFLAEGVTCKHCIFVCSLDCDVFQLMHELPSPADISETSRSSTSVMSNPTEELKIAWRYQDNPAVQSASSLSSTTAFGHHFDLSTPYSKEAVANAEVSYWPQPWPLSDSCRDPYMAVLHDLQDRVHKQGHSVRSAQPRRTVLRVALHRLGSPLWPRADHHLPRFLSCLRSIVQSANATAVITLPTDLLEPETVELCEHLSDNVIRLQSLASNPNPLFSEYSGLLNVVKLATINTLSTHVPDTHDWAFKLRKKKFVIEKLHLPPELQDSAQREQDEGLVSACTGSSKPAGLDF